MDRRDLPALIDQWKRDLDGRGRDFLRDRGLSDEYTERYHFGYVASGYYADSISIPILDGKADIKTVRFRRLTGEPKYDHPKGERAHLFNISSVRHPLVYITEGEFDATILEQTGRHAVGVPGINNFLPAWRWLFTGSAVRIVFDSDERGTEAWQNVRRAVGGLRRQLDPLVDDLQVVELPEGQDVTSLYVQDPAALDEVLGQYDD